MFAQKRYMIIGGTTTITILTKESIWMAADSRETTIRNKEIAGSRLHLKLNVCKNTFFTVTGSWASIVDDKGSVRFDAKKIITSCIEKYQAFNDLFRNSILVVHPHICALFCHSLF